MYQVVSCGNRIRCRLAVCRWEVFGVTLIQVRPDGWNERSASVWQYQNQMQTSMSVRPADNFQKLPLQWVAVTYYMYLRRETVEMGSMS